MDLLEIASRLAGQAEELRFGGAVAYVYNPLSYAWPAHRQYLERWGSSSREIVLLGMNPGPWGMSQTGVPFGEVGMVRDWLGIDAPVGRPPKQHPKRPIEGWDCRRSEVSGRRLWGWARDRFGTPDRFFRRFLVLNYCPLAFLEESGRNLTPDRLPSSDRAALFDCCDRALRRSVQVLEPTWVVGVGAFAEFRARQALIGIEPGIGRVLHPSPASPAANRGWADQVDVQLAALGIDSLGAEVP